MPYVNVYVDTTDVLDELDDRALLEELDRRRAKGVPTPTEFDLTDYCVRLRAAHHAGDTERVMQIAEELYRDHLGVAI